MIQIWKTYEDCFTYTDLIKCHYKTYLQLWLIQIQSRSPIFYCNYSELSKLIFFVFNNEVPHQLTIRLNLSHGPRADAQNPEVTEENVNAAEWLARPLGLTLLDFFLWGYIKSVIKNKPLELGYLRRRIRLGTSSLTPQMFNNVRRLIQRCCPTCATLFLVGIQTYVVEKEARS